MKVDLFFWSLTLLMKNMKKLILICVGLIFLAACHEKNKNKVSAAELMKSREIKKVSEAEILKKGGEIGSEILNSIQLTIADKVTSDGIDCHIDHWPEIDSLNEYYKSSIQRINEQTESNTELELQLLAAYQYNLENNLAPTSSVQKFDSKTVLFAYPIDKESSIYIYCLDSIGQSRAEMWSIRLPIKEIVTRL